MSSSVRAALTLIAALSGCATRSAEPVATPSTPSGWFDNTGRDDVQSGGIELVPVNTPEGTFRVWTKRVGNNPNVKVLLLHGGPGFTHEYFEAFDTWFPGAGIEYYYYDQLGSHYSDQPEAPALWDLPRFVDEVEQVRLGLDLPGDDMVLLGHSWGGLLAIEYALAYPDNLQALVVSNMMSSIPAYNAYARDVIMPRMDPAVLGELQAIEAAADYQNPRYMELLMPHHYVLHILRMPPDQWPDPVMRTFEHLNPAVYIPMQGPSELGASGKLVDWDRSGDLGKIEVPTLVIGAEHDTMDPAHMKAMASQLPNGRYLHCPNSGHLAMYGEDQATYMNGVIDFLRDVGARTP